MLREAQTHHYYHNTQTGWCYVSHAASVTSTIPPPPPPGQARPQAAHEAHTPPGRRRVKKPSPPPRHDLPHPGTGQGALTHPTAINTVHSVDNQRVKLPQQMPYPPHVLARTHVGEGGAQTMHLSPPPLATTRTCCHIHGYSLCLASFLLSLPAYGLLG